MQVRKRVFRFTAVFLGLIIFLLVFSVKLVLIQVFKSDHLASLADKQHAHLIEIEPIRGSIYDRNHRPLAFNVSVYSLYANPRIMSEEQKQEAVEKLSTVLKLDPEFLKDRLSRSKYFVWIARKLSQELAEDVRKLKITGLSFRKESKRFYPNGSLAAHIIGFAGVDNRGLEGLELQYDKYLKGEPGHSRIIKDARQRELLIEKNFLPPVDGFHLVLTIDETIQYIAEKALANGVEKFHPKGASVIVLDTRTGEILALANYPTYNLDDVSSSTLESRTNRAISYVYEPGSVFKIITASAALEERRFKESDIIFCENGEYRIANHTLTDHRPHGNLTFREVFGFSSNIGTAKIAQKLGPEIIYKYGKRFRFGRKTNVDLRGEVDGWLKKPSQWSKTTIGAIPIGYEITVTPLQLVSAIAAIANEGIMVKPYVVKYIKDNHDQIIKSYEPQVLGRAISSDTALRVKDILVGVVEYGTAKNAQIKGVKVAGKTGTARKVVNGAYAQGKYYATFMGFAPADNPRLAAIVVFDEPKPYYFGGTVSAPVFQEIMENSLRYLQSSEQDSYAIRTTP
ncbi:MAG: penicillin-binding protein 2 [Candidatus Omnitrophica bacterium]|nr:penicillin-binding protein 2 [Candidatus Omnitrophota bacterium]